MKIISLGIFLTEERGLMILYLKQFVYFCLIDSSKTERERKKNIWMIVSEVEMFALQILAIALGILFSFLSVHVLLSHSVYIF